MREVFPLELPSVFGYEVAGIVEAAGPDVDGFAVGDEVFGSVMGGGYAEYAVVPVQMVARKPTEVSFTDAAALPVAAATAFDGLTQLGLAAGQTLLIVGVGGGVGVAASGALNPFVTAVFPLDQAAEALSAVETGHALGKIVLEVN
jgi:NADPH:quinone reductase-like Zn-dependent oxidoreductase